MRKGKVVDKDRLWRQVIRSYREADEKYVTVGIHADAEPYQRGQDEPANVAQIASFHEYGTDHMPQRAFMRPTVDANREEYSRLIDRVFWLSTIGKLTRRKALAVLGQKVASDIKRAIVDLVSPPLAPSTIERKRRSLGKRRKYKVRSIRRVGGVDTGNPLIDTGHLRASVTYVVHGFGGPSSGGEGEI